MTNRVLIADDDAAVRRVLSRLLAAEPEPCKIISAADGTQALALAREERPDLIVLDIAMPGSDGLSVLKALRAGPATSLIPVILVSGRGDAEIRVGGLDLGADDYLSKPFDVDELKARARRLLRRVRQDLAANPLTRLPGNPAIEEEVVERIRRGRPFAFFHADIDRFKSFNDRYGFARGDALIKATAELLTESLRAGAGGFVGHIGGDDFALVTEPGDAALVAQRASAAFDHMAPSFYAPDDRENGFVAVKDRQGHLRRFPLVTLSMGIVSSERRRLSHYGRVVEIASEMKAYLKADGNPRLSRFAFDRRQDFME